MRDFKNPYYDGPDCVCCKPKEEYSEGVAQENKRVVDILKKERREWGLGTLASRIIDNLLAQVEGRND
jgi:hypothetical protein